MRSTTAIILSCFGRLDSFVLPIPYIFLSSAIGVPFLYLYKDVLHHIDCDWLGVPLSQTNPAYLLGG